MAKPPKTKGGQRHVSQRTPKVKDAVYDAFYYTFSDGLVRQVSRFSNGQQMMRTRHRNSYYGDGMERADKLEWGDWYPVSAEQIDRHDSWNIWEKIDESQINQFN